MDYQKILKKYNEMGPYDLIYGFMYGKPTYEIWTTRGRKEIQDKVISICKMSLDITKTEDAFLYVWGMPGPQYNEYKFSDYGITWAFTERELKDGDSN